MTNGQTIQIFNWLNKMIPEENLIVNSKGGLYSDYEASEWSAIVMYVIQKLHEFLGVTLIFKEDDFKDVGNGFCIEFIYKFSEIRPMNIHIKGTLGADILGDNESLRITATIFIYSDEQKMQLSNGYSYFEIEYIPRMTGGYWQPIGWMYDEYDEF